VANDVTDAIVIAVDGLVHHDKLFATAKRYASPNIWARIKARSLERRTGCGTDSVEFMFLLWLADLPASGCVKSRKALAPSARQQDQAMSACAARHDKLAANYLAFIKFASIRIWLHANESAAQSDHDFIALFEQDLRANTWRLSGGGSCPVRGSALR
jgi:hypothetical protein